MCTWKSAGQFVKREGLLPLDKATDSQPPVALLDTWNLTVIAGVEGVHRGDVRLHQCRSRRFRIEGEGAVHDHVRALTPHLLNVNGTNEMLNSD